MGNTQTNLRRFVQQHPDWEEYCQVSMRAKGSACNCSIVRATGLLLTVQWRRPALRAGRMEVRARAGFGQIWW